MPAWLASAIRMLGLALGGIGATEVAERAFGTPGGGSNVFGFDVDLNPFSDPQKPKRRRRRRALTASDKADIGFIVGLLGPAAGKQFAVTIATRHG